MNPSPRPIFQDNSGRRWRHVKRYAASLALVLSVIGAAFCLSILVLPMSPIPRTLRSFLPKLETHQHALSRYMALKEKQSLSAQIAKDAEVCQTRHPRSSGTPYSTVVGFYVNWDENSFYSFRHHVDSLTHVMPEWLALGTDGKSFTSRKDNDNDPKMEALARQHHVEIIPMLDNVDKGIFRWSPVKKLLSADHDTQLAFAEDLRDYLKDRQYDGINLDLEPNYDGMSDKELAATGKLIHDGFPRFLRTLRSVFAPAHLVITQDLPADDPNFDYDTLSDLNDFAVIMMYDQHNVGGEPGPIASQQWIEQVAAKIFNRMDSSKVVIGMENRCYDWPIDIPNNGDCVPAGPGRAVDMATALSYAQQAGAKLEMDEDELNPYFIYADPKDQDHLVYMLDAVTAYNHVRALNGYKPRGAALWYMGSEDPTIWSFLSKDKLGQTVPASALSQVVCISGEPKGEGELTEVGGSLAPGQRKLTKDADGLFVSEAYSVYPQPYVREQFGDVKNAVALTFDDGPDPVWTPQILDILRQKNVPATFFVIGENADRYHDIVRDEWNLTNSGGQRLCEIGNHTYTHPHLAEASPLRAELEVNATQRVIESITGHSTRLLRPPFGQGADANADSPDEISMLLRMQELGYITVGMNIDSDDYMRPGVKHITNTVINELPKGHVILFHDGGGNRSQTLKALPAVIDAIRARGYRFVSVADLCKGSMNVNLFPPVPQSEEAIAGLDRIVFESGFIVNSAISILFLTAVALCVLRLLMVGTFALMQARILHRHLDDSYTPPVTVIVPGYNEEKVICRTVSTILANDYPDVRVIAVDDGSTDNTSSVLHEQFGSDPRVTIIRKENGGKASALNVALDVVETEVVVCVDADTIIAPDAIRKLARHFADPHVGAVAGNIKVGNRTNLLGMWQSLEYITSQNADRRAYALMDSVPVVPGALGAWRRSAIIRAGGYCPSTLAEDTDLTFRVRLLGYATKAENDALAFTEAPDNLRALTKQRFRWTFGILQALWKHHNIMWRPGAGAMGMVVMPSMWVFNIFFQMLAPVVDIAVILSLMHGQAMMVITYWAALYVLDFFASLVAFGLDRENPKSLVWLFVQRLFYRQFMYYIIWKSLMAAVKGHAVGWGKLQRKATAEASLW